MCLLDQLAELLFEAVLHARLGHADGRGTDPQASGDLGRGMPLDSRQPERPPGPLLDLAADQLQRAPPEGFQLGRGVLLQHLAKKTERRPLRSASRRPHRSRPAARRPLQGGLSSPVPPHFPWREDNLGRQASIPPKTLA
jgi:hypothetical protein